MGLGVALGKRSSSDNGCGVEEALWEMWIGRWVQAMRVRGGAQRERGKEESEQRGSG